MAKNAVTDTHVGASPASWDHDGFAEVRHQLGFNEDVAPRHRGKGKTVVAPSHSDFRLGSQVVATIKRGLPPDAGRKELAECSSAIRTETNLLSVWGQFFGWLLADRSAGIAILSHRLHTPLAPRIVSL